MDLVFIALFLVSLTLQLSTQCNVSVNNFVASFRILNHVAVHIPEESLGNIDAHLFKIVCPSGFDDVGQPHHEHTELPLLCDAGEVYFKNETLSHKYPPNMQINCRSQALTFYQAKGNKCAFSNIAIGYKFDENIITHAESCFDLFEMKVKYMHFVARSMNSLVSTEVSGLLLLTQHNFFVCIPEQCHPR